MLVVESSFIIIKEDIIGLGDRFEFYFGLRSVVFGDFVRVMGKGSLSVLLDQSKFHVYSYRCRRCQKSSNLYCSVSCALH